MSTKRKRRQGTLDSLKRSKAFITPEREPNKKIHGKRAVSKALVSTPSTVAKTKEVGVLEHQKNLPLAIYQNCKYDRRGQSKTISKEFFDAALQIEVMCIIPSDFGRSVKYGPFSGISYEERLVSSFLSGTIKLKKSKLKMFSNVVQTKTMKGCIKSLSMEYDGDLDRLSIERALYLMDGNMEKSKVLLEE